MHKRAAVTCAEASERAKIRCDDQCSFRDTVRPVFTPGDYCRRHTGLAEKRVDKKDNNEDLNEQNKVKKRDVNVTICFPIFYKYLICKDL